VKRRMKLKINNWQILNMILLCGLMLNNIANAMEATVATKIRFQHFLTLADDGDKDGVNTLIEEGIEINGQDERGRTALMYAAEKGHLGVVELLIKKGALIDVNDNEGSNVLSQVVFNGDKDIVALLLKIQDKKNISNLPLETAAMQGHKGIVGLLLSYGANVDKVDEYGKTPLHRASYGGYNDIIEILLDNGASINVKRVDNWSVLMSAVISGKLSSVELLLDEGVDYTVQTSASCNVGSTALSLALRDKHYDIAKRLSREAKKIDSNNYFVLESLVSAAYFGDLSLVNSLLLTKNMDVNAKLKFTRGKFKSKSALMAASINGQIDVAKLLISFGAEIDLKDKFGRTALIFAVTKGDLNMAKFLLSNSADINVKNKYGQTALMAAIKSGQTKIAKWLVSHGALVNEKDNDKKTL